MARPRLVAFDLDGTIWLPEMYHMWGGGGSPFRRQDGRVRDRQGTEVRFLGATKRILHTLATDEQWRDVQVAYVSKTDEPEWAREVMQLMHLDERGEHTMKTVVHHEEIYFGNKQQHFQALHKKTGIPYSAMIFFDNEQGNIRDVSKLGVHCIYTPNGVTEREWQSALESWREKTAGVAKRASQ
eukprot:TRINITY_DN1503_c0_g1_i3.p2 TRINITY_DN1503_c0_g1~~TRINITY_DN1503_c0_g1_i3.p2  ORF type:complete len:201 (-),score=35.00 TRINITY_DN1503_c0_g1_i3:7-558(-)